MVPLWRPSGSNINSETPAWACQMPVVLSFFALGLHWNARMSMSDACSVSFSGPVLAHPCISISDACSVIIFQFAVFAVLQCRGWNTTNKQIIYLHLVSDTRIYLSIRLYTFIWIPYAVIITSYTTIYLQIRAYTSIRGYPTILGTRGHPTILGSRGYPTILGTHGYTTMLGTCGYPPIC